MRTRRKTQLSNSKKTMQSWKKRRNRGMTVSPITASDTSDTYFSFSGQYATISLDLSGTSGTFMPKGDSRVSLPGMLSLLFEEQTLVASHSEEPQK